VPLQLNWQSKTTIQEGDLMEGMIEKAHKHVDKARNMRHVLQGKASMALEWYKTITNLSTIEDE
jgi:hypothetical protein